MILLYILRQLIISIPVVLIFNVISLLSNSSISIDFIRMFINAGFLTLFIVVFKYFNYRSNGLKIDSSDLSFAVIPEFQKIIISKLDSVNALNRLKSDFKFKDSVFYTHLNVINIDLNEDFWKTEKIVIQFNALNDDATEYVLKSKSRYLNLFGDFGQNKCNVSYLEKLLNA